MKLIGKLFMHNNQTKYKKTNMFSLYLRRVTAMSAICFCVGFLAAQSGGITTKDSKAKEAIDAAHKALGGADKIGGVKSLVIKGTETRASFTSSGGGPMTKTGSTTQDFEIRILLPDNIIKIENFPERTMGGISIPARTTYSGISKGSPLANNAVMTGFAGTGNIQKLDVDPETAAKAQAAAANTQIDEWSRFLTGILAKAGPAPLTLSSGSTPGVFTLIKSDGNVGEIEFDSKTGYPSVIKYKARGSALLNMAKGPSGKTSMSFNMADMSDMSDMVDNEIRFRDRFSVNGIMFPKIITMTGPTMDREMRIETVQINPNLSLKDFEVPKQ